MARRSARFLTRKRSSCIKTTASAPCPITEDPVQPSNDIIKAVEELWERSGHQVQVSPEPVPKTNLFVVHTANHPFRPEYTIAAGVFGFRVPFNLPDAAPEDSFFIAPVETKLINADPV